AGPTITLNRPAKVNAMSTAMWVELEKAMDEAENDAAIRVLVLRGAGRAFSSGNDMSERTSSLGAWQHRLTEISRRILKLWNLRPVTIAMVHGHCLASGCELAAMCDITIASEDAKFGEPEIHHGSMAQVFLPWVLGMKRAKEFILTGDSIDAHTAERIGLVNRVVPPDRLEEETYTLARRLAKVPAVGLEFNKRTINKMFEFAGLIDGRDYMDQVSTIVHVLMSEVEGPAGEGLQQVKYAEGMKAFLKARAARMGAKGPEESS
ncbi:MAG: enoyl-CoA hydratase/isomerase family protein, partial [Nitrospiraceae bacterium]|nr:enoyl-CoA hydratase/isomerase family protein [Nitrospiraceae bacterium]